MRGRETCVPGPSSRSRHETSGPKACRIPAVRGRAGQGTIVFSAPRNREARIVEEDRVQVLRDGMAPATSQGSCRSRASSRTAAPRADEASAAGRGSCSGGPQQLPGLFATEAMMTDEMRSGRVESCRKTV